MGQNKTTEIIPVKFETDNIFQRIDDRSDEGETRPDLISRSGVSSRTLYNLINHEPQVRIQSLAQLADFLGFQVVISFEPKEALKRKQKKRA